MSASLNPSKYPYELSIIVERLRIGFKRNESAPIEVKVSDGTRKTADHIRFKLHYYLKALIANGSEVEARTAKQVGDFYMLRSLETVQGTFYIEAKPRAGSLISIAELTLLLDEITAGEIELATEQNRAETEQSEAETRRNDSFTSALQQLGYGADTSTSTSTNTDTK